MGASVDSAPHGCPLVPSEPFVQRKTAFEANRPTSHHVSLHVFAWQQGAQLELDFAPCFVRVNESSLHMAKVIGVEGHVAIIELGHAPGETNSPGSPLAFDCSLSAPKAGDQCSMVLASHHDGFHVGVACGGLEPVFSSPEAGPGRWLAASSSSTTRPPPPTPSPPPPKPPGPNDDDEGEEDEGEDTHIEHAKTYASSRDGSAAAGGGPASVQGLIPLAARGSSPYEDAPTPMSGLLNGDPSEQALLEMQAAPVTVIVGGLALGVFGLLLLVLLGVCSYRLAAWWSRSGRSGRPRGKLTRLPTTADDEDYDCEDIESPRVKSRQNSNRRGSSHSRTEDMHDADDDIDDDDDDKSEAQSQSTGSKRSMSQRGKSTNSTSSRSHAKNGEKSGASATNSARGSNRPSSESAKKAPPSEDDDASEVASRLAVRMNALLDQLAPPASRRRARIDSAVRRELQGGADPVDILEALEMEIKSRKKRNKPIGGAAADSAAPSAATDPKSLAVTLSANNLQRLKRIHEAEEDQMTNLSGLQAAAADEAYKEEQARLERGSVIMQNIFKGIEDDFEDPQDAIQPWDSISNVLPPPSVIQMHRRAPQH